MNIVKLLDKIMPDSYEESAFFNKYLKGKYAYWIHMRYIVPIGLFFENDIMIGMKHEGYVACEEDINKLLIKEDGTYPQPYGSPYLDTYKQGIVEFIDIRETDRVNSTYEYIIRNNYVPDQDITIDELKVFRTWLAQELLRMDMNEDTAQHNYIYLTEENTHVLNYYANNMYDSTIESLMSFSKYNKISYNHTSTIPCGCINSDSNLNFLELSDINICNPVEIYREYMYSAMVDMFVDINFWIQWPSGFLMTFQQYINNIIKVDLPFKTKSNIYTKVMADCSCISDTSQEKYIDILRRLSISLSYIINKDITGHKNYITDAFTDWATNLYQEMYWV